MDRLKKKFSYEKVQQIQAELLQERYDWEQEWVDISNYLLPGRGIYNAYTKPKKRKLTNEKIINTVGEDSLYVLTSGIHGRLTSPALPWFELAWAEEAINKIEELKAWLQQADVILKDELQKSNFYRIINGFYVEYTGFGTGSIFVGTAPKGNRSRLSYELLTAGEYSFAYGTDNEPTVYTRIIYMSLRQMVQKFPDGVSSDAKDKVERNASGIDKVEGLVLEIVQKEKYQDKDYVQVYYEVTGLAAQKPRLHKTPLKVKGFYEWPYPTARWSVIGSDTYGIGPGSRALPQIKRLQEMEKAFLMATHKSIDPPLNAPGRMRGNLNTLPGGQNYYSNPAEQVTELYRVNFDYAGVSNAIERVEERIQRNFYNDVFLTSSRDPNASPLRTGQVNVQEQEKLLRLGPVVEGLQSEFFTPAIGRSFNLLLRAGAFPPLDPQYAELVAQVGITLTSPMAKAQKSAQIQGTDSFMAFLGQAAQFDPTILDNVNSDAAARQRADIEGVSIGVLRPESEVKAMRAARVEQRAAQQKAEQDAQQAQLVAQGGQIGADTAKTQAEAGQILAETQQTTQETGL